MNHLESRNAGVDFMLDNMQSKAFAQTLLGFNTVTRMEYNKDEQVMSVNFESEDFTNWLEATDGALESGLKEHFQGTKVRVESVHDRGFDISIPLPDGEISKEIKDVVATLREVVYIIVFKSIIDTYKSSSKRYNYKQGTCVQLNRKTKVYLGRSDNLIVTYLFENPQNEMEKELLHVFLQEFAGTKRKINTAPSVIFKKPQGAQVEPILEFGFSPKHCQNMDEVCKAIFQIPNDIDYHIKCAKSHFHHNMHLQVKSWLKVLNNADPNYDTSGKGTKQRQSVRKLK